MCFINDPISRQNNIFSFSVFERFCVFFYVLLMLSTDHRSSTCSENEIQKKNYPEDLTESKIFIEKHLEISYILLCTILLRLLLAATKSKIILMSLLLLETSFKTFFFLHSFRSLLIQQRVVVCYQVDRRQCQIFLFEIYNLPIGNSRTLGQIYN